MAEYTLYGKRRLCYTEVTDFTDFQGIGKDPLYKRFDSVYSVIEKNISAQYRDFLAHPIYSSDEDRIQWFVKEWETVPYAYNNLSDTEREKYDKIKETTLAEYNRVQKSLSGEDRQILTAALQHIDDDFMFCYDDKIVVVAWGMFPDSNKHIIKGTVIHDLEILNNHKIKFNPGEHGKLTEKVYGVINRSNGAILTSKDIPEVIANPGYSFQGWDPTPLGMKVSGPITFNAVYETLLTISGEEIQVNFAANEGGNLEGITEVTINKGATLESSQIPTPVPEAGFRFVGWDTDPESQAIDSNITFNALFERINTSCKFDAGAHGSIIGNSQFTKPWGTIFNNDDTPQVKPKRGYKFVGWDKSPKDYLLNDDIVFTAQYEKLPWYKRLWCWLTDKGCFKWLLWFLLFLLIVLLIAWLLRGCESKSRKGIENGGPDTTIVTPLPDDNDDPKKPIYTPPTPIVDEEGKLPDNDFVVSPIVGDDGKEPPIIKHPGAPDIIANKLNIFFDHADVDLEQFIKDFSNIYPSDQCPVIGYDKNIPMVQISMPEDMRSTIRENLPNQLPDYDFFIIDESIFSIQTNLSTNSSNAGWHLDAIGLKEGWKYTKGSSNIIVAVVDDGFDLEHEILQGRIVHPYNVFTKDENIIPSVHGTHVAGLAVGSDKLYDQGISGVAPNCKLMPVQVFEGKFCTFSSITSGIMYAIHNGANVINVSLGPKFDGLKGLPLEDQKYIAETLFQNEEKVWRRIIQIANEHNAIIVFAAGNDTILASIPPENRTNNTINVAAVDPNYNCANFSNYSTGTNISAPGEDIISSVPKNNYESINGTSMAAPIVSGTIALMKSLKPNLSVAEILHILQATGIHIDNNIPPMIQVDDALLAVKTGKIPKNNQIGQPNPDNNPNPRAGIKPNPPGGFNPKPYRPNPGEGTGKGTGVGTGIGNGKGNGRVGDIPGNDNGFDSDYDAIRALIAAYEKKINELKKLLPENN